MPPFLSRRSFLSGALTLSAVTTLRLKAAGSSFVEYRTTIASIDVVQVNHGARTKLQSLMSPRPAFLAIDATGKYLFAVNEIDDYQGLAAGAVESYAVQPGSGRLTLISRQSLSLSATLARHFAVSPRGDYIVVPAYGGGLYNVLPISNEGEIGSVCHILKEIGSGLHPITQASAHPHSVAFHPSGKFVIGTDLGSDRINVFAFNRGHLKKWQQVSVTPGTGPSSLAFDASGTWLSVKHEFSPLVSHYHFHLSSGRIS